MQQELDETVEDHIIELRSEGLEDLKDELTETYEKFKKDLAINIDSIINTISDTSNNLVGSLTDINNTVNGFLGTFNPELSLEDLGAEAFTQDNTTNLSNIDTSKEIADSLEHYEDNYSADEIARLRELQGTTFGIKTSTDDIKTTEQNHSESLEVLDKDFNANNEQDEVIASSVGKIIELENSTLIPITNSLAESTQYLAGIFNQMADSKPIVDAVPLNSLFDNVGEDQLSLQPKSITNNINVQSLIHVEGDVDQNTLDQLQEIANGLISNRQFLNATYDYIVKEQAKEAKKRF